MATFVVLIQLVTISDKDFNNPDNLTLNVIMMDYNENKS